MKNRIINYSLFIFLSVFLLFACQTDLQDVVEKDEAIVKESLTVESAKKWLLENYGDVINVNASSARISGDKSERDVKWNKGVEKQIKTPNGVVNVVIFPVKIKNQKDILEDASLWVVNDKGNIYSKFLELYNADYRKMDKKNAKQQNYKQQFIGSLNVYDIKNGLEMGHYYENGKISGTIMSFDGEKASFVTTKKGAKTNWCRPFTVCPDVNGSTTYLSSTGVITVTIGRCATAWSCPQYFIYDGDQSYDSAYWDYYWQFITEANRYNMRDINNSALIDNCLKSLTNCLAGGNVPNKLQDMIENKYIQNGGDFNLVFSENPNLPVSGQFTGNSGNSVVNSNVQLNPNLLNSRAFEYGVAVVLHESLHGIMELNGINYGSEAQVHERMLFSYFEILVAALSDATGISRSDAGALTLNGFPSVFSSNPTFFAQKAQSVGLTTQQVSDVASEYKNKTKGSNCN